MERTAKQLAAMYRNAVREQQKWLSSMSSTATEDSEMYRQVFRYKNADRYPCGICKSTNVVMDGDPTFADVDCLDCGSHAVDHGYGPIGWIKAWDTDRRIEQVCRTKLAA